MPALLNSSACTEHWSDPYFAHVSAGKSNVTSAPPLWLMMRNDRWMSSAAFTRVESDTCGIELPPSA
jgi:hypothetical protein